MSWFVVIGGLLFVGILIVLVRPLLKQQGDGAVITMEIRDLNLKVLRDQVAELEVSFRDGQIDKTAYEQAKQELERRTLDDVGQKTAVVGLGKKKNVLAVLLAVLVPVVVFSLYALLGTPDAITGKPVAKSSQEGEHALSAEQISAMVERLALRLQENPNDGQGWLMLGRSYAVLGRYPESAAAFGRALSMLPPDAQHYADFADIVAMAQGKSLTGEPEKLVRRSLEIDPNNIKALALAGTIAFDRQNYQLAIREWQKVVAIVPEGSSVAVGMLGSIRDAENRLAISGKQVDETKSLAKTESSIVAKVAGVVELDPKFKTSVTQGDTVFIFARAVEGPKMPVAMLRIKVSDLPFKFSLDDSMSMTPQFKLSTVGKVIVGARVSKSGDALSRTGDMEGISSAISVGTENVRIIISTIVQ
jgi:cytochrome c-type biogenesis protein CcmH